MPYHKGQQLQLLEGELGEGASSKENEKEQKRNMRDFSAGYSGVVSLGRINSRETSAK